MYFIPLLGVHWVGIVFKVIMNPYEESEVQNVACILYQTRFIYRAMENTGDHYTYLRCSLKFLYLSQFVYF